MLLLSGIGAGPELQRVGVPVVHDLPGVGATCTTTWTASSSSTRRACRSPSACRSPARCAAVKGIVEWRKPPHRHADHQLRRGRRLPRSQPDEPAPDLQLHFVIGKLVDHGRKTVFGHGYSCHLCVLRPKAAAASDWPAPTRWPHR
jgi:choline dehydrogenase-like flavoprotein